MAEGAPVAGRGARLDRVLADLLGRAPELEAAAVVSFDGLAMASLLPQGMDEDRVAAMSAALLTLGERAAEGLGRGELNQVWIEGRNGTVFLVSADEEAVLVAVAAAGAKAGLMLYEIRTAAKDVAEVLRAGTDVPFFEQLLESAAAHPVAPTGAAHRADAAAALPAPASPPPVRSPAPPPPAVPSLSAPARDPLRDSLASLEEYADRLSPEQLA